MDAGGSSRFDGADSISRSLCGDVGSPVEACILVGILERLHLLLALSETQVISSPFRQGDAYGLDGEELVLVEQDALVACLWRAYDPRMLIAGDGGELLQELDLLLDEVEGLGGEWVVTDLSSAVDGGLVVSYIHWLNRD